MTVDTTYSVPKEAQELFVQGILKNPLMKNTPSGLVDLSEHVTFEGLDAPSVPINWRFAESISALKAFEATMLNLLVMKKYSVPARNVVINTDHASLFFMSAIITQLIGKDGKPTPLALSPEADELFPNADLHRSAVTLHRAGATNIFKTKDGRYYHVHGSMNPEPTLSALGLPMEGEEGESYDDVAEKLQKVVGQIDSASLDELMNEQYRQAGTIAWTSDEYFASEHGKQSGKVGLYEIIKEDSEAAPASWWPEDSSLPSSPKRPLAGLKVVDLTRVIASPAITRGLAEMGASVMRVTSSQITDLYQVHQDLNWGKWNCNLHFKDSKDLEKLKDLIREADVVVDGYRPGVLEKYGVGKQGIFELVKGRGRGIIYVRENCYGWHGPWSHRSGWQQISDACCGVSASYSQAMGFHEAVTPVFPNSDYCTGVCGSTAVLDALIQRAQNGGDYQVDIALNYYSQWLVRSCGTYPEQVWKDVWSRHDNIAFRNYHNMPYLLPLMMKSLYTHDAKTLFNPSFFQPRHSKAIGRTLIVVKPVAQWEEEATELRYNVGTRGNGTDAPVWPKDLTVETVVEVTA